MPFGSLWIPVLVSAIAVFVLSSLAHMVLRYHRKDYLGLPNEDAVAEALRKAGPSPGVYHLPHCDDPSQMKEPAVQKKFADGPVAIVTVVRSGAPRLATYLVQWFLLCLFISFTAAYVARHALTYGSAGLEIMRITGSVALVGYAYGHLQGSIWQGIPWANSLRGIADAIVYALATGLVFRLLWPAA